MPFTRKVVFVTYGPTMASGYDRGRRLRTEDVDRWMSAARPYLPEDGGRVLDPGAGTGRFSDALARSGGAMVVACEPFSAMRSVCRSRCSVAVVSAAQRRPRPSGPRVPTPCGLRRSSITSPNCRRSPRTCVASCGRPATCCCVVGSGGGGTGVVPLLARRLGGGQESAAVPGPDRQCSRRCRCGDGDRVQIEQVFAGRPEELIEKVRSRSLSNLAGLSELAFQQGLRALRQHADDGVVTGAVLDRLDFVVFGRPSRPRR